MKKKTNILIYVFLIFGLIVILAPMGIAVLTSVKTQREALQSLLTLPKSICIENYINVLKKPGFLNSFVNTVIVTVVSCFGVVLLTPMVSYAIARNMDKKKYYMFLYFFLILGIFVPFQVKMMPLVRVMSDFSLLNIPGLIIVYQASATCEAVFLYTAYIKGIPADMEEAAYIDGASTFDTYRMIVFPLIKPMTATVVIMDGLWFWGDFLLPVLTLNRTPKDYTLMLFAYNFRASATGASNYPEYFAALLLTMVPIVIVYMFMQKQIMGGLTGGAVKG